MHGERDTRKIILIGGPTGGGKTSTITGLIASYHHKIARAVTTTTRAPRDGERHGIDYFFMSKGDFRLGQQIGAFVESDADYTRDVYGLSWQALDAVLDSDKAPIISMTLPGVKALRAIFPNALTIFIGPEDFNDLAVRIADRSDVNERLAKAREEIATAHEHYSVILLAPNGGVPLLVRRSLLLIKDYVEGS